MDDGVVQPTLTDLRNRRSEASYSEPDGTLTDTDSEVLFDLMERLTQRGYRVQVTITLPSGGRLTLDGRPGTPVGLPAFRQMAGDHHAHHDWQHTHPGGPHGPDEH